MKVFRRVILSIRGLMGGLVGLGVCYAPFSVAVALVMFVVTDSAPAAACTTCTVTNSGIEVTVACSMNSITLTQIYGIDNKQSYLNQTLPAPLLSYVDTNSDGTTSTSYISTFNDVVCNLNSNSLSISANSFDNFLSFSITLSPDGSASGGNVIIVSTEVSYQVHTNADNATIFFYAMLPKIQSFNIPNTPTLPGAAMAMVPQMIGGVLPLVNISSDLGPGVPATFGTPATTFGLPTNLNVMEIAEVYDGSSNSGGGLFFADLDGDYDKNIAPLQFNLAYLSSSGPYQIVGYWTALLKFNQPLTLPRLAIGIHPSGDWHYAVDYYVAKRSPKWTFPDTPEWFREAAGIYFVGVAGGGSFFGTFPFTTLGDAYFGIQLFACNSRLTDSTGTVIATTGTPPNLPGHRCLLDVYDDARKLDTNVIYLGEWWSQGDAQGTWGYGNRGDWIVAPSLGGAAGLKQAVDDIHCQNSPFQPCRHPPGKVILYLEPYVVDGTSMVYAKEDLNWKLLLGPPIPSAPARSCKPNCANTDIANTQWQDYLIQRAVDLIMTTDVDGFFLDSWGWQMNWPAHSSIEDVDYTSKQWTAAALRFVDRLRAAIRAVPGHADAIVMGENNTGQLPFHWDGGSAADLSPWNTTLFTEDQGKLSASPIRYAMPNANFFVNGGNLGGLNQVFAAGHNLALGPFWLTDVLTDVTDAQNFAAHGAYGVAAFTTLTTTKKHPNSASVPSSASPDLTVGLSISATSVPPGTTITKIKGTSITLSQNATATGAVPAEFLWPIPPIAAITTLTTTNDEKSASVSLSTGLSAGQFISATSVPFSTTIATVDGTTTSGTNITLSNEATATGLVPAAFSNKPIPQLAAITMLTTYGSYLASVSASTGLSAGQFISANSVSLGTTIATIDGTNITLSQNATATGAVPAKFWWAPPQRNSVVSDYISFLMKTRQKYADALVYGTQLPMPTTTSPDIVAYMYQGTASQVLTIVNNSTQAQSATIQLDPSYGTGSWTQILPSASNPVTVSETYDGKVTLTILPVPTSLPAPTPGTVPEMGLVILQRSCPSSALCPAPKAYGTTSKVPLMNETFPSRSMTNWTDWMVSAGKPVPSGRWTVSAGSSGTNVLNVQSLNDSSLLFYDPFGGGDFTYSNGVLEADFYASAGITIEFSTASGSAGYGQAGLSFRLSDNQQTPDWGDQGYDAVFTNVPTPRYLSAQHQIVYATGNVQLLKRQRGAPSFALCPAVPFDVSTGATNQISVSAQTTWTNSIPSFPSSTTFTVSVNGQKLLSCNDPSPYLSGRFGVNSSNANASFTCLQADDDGTIPKPCPASPP